MTKRIYKDWISQYMEYSAYSEAPDKFHFWTAVSTVAGALRRRVWIDQGYFQWTPNFYVVFVAPPGIVSKSTTASIGMNLLRQIPDIVFGPDAVTWQSLIQSLASSTQGVEIDGLSHAMSAITISSSEFGTFLNPNDREMVDVLVSLWDGQLGVFEKATKTQGNDSVENPWINIIACTTPAWIAGNFPEYMIGGGFTSRTVFVYADRKRHLVPYPKDQLPPDFHQIGKNLVHDLEISSLEIKGEYKLTPDATKWGELWYERHYANRPPHLDNERFGGYLARKQTHIHKLAMVIEASKNGGLHLTKESLIAADAITTGIELDMPKVFAHIGQNDATRLISELTGYVQSKQMVTHQEAYQTFSTKVTGADFDIIVASCMKAGYITSVQNGTELYYKTTLTKAEVVSVVEDKQA